VQSETVSLLATCEVRIDASPETVFEYFVDPEKMVRWMGLSADLDPRPGGRYDVHVTPPFHAVGEFKEIDPPRFVSFTWGWDGGPVPPGSSLVRVTLTPDGDGTTVVLEHSQLPDDEQVKGHREGWEHYFERLAIVATGGDAGVDPWTTR
jgi:uncharacterized protein YndB with AHSA1/START domain